MMLLVPRIDYMVVKWDKPKMPFFKLNTDGSMMQNSPAGAGGICRDSRRNIIMAFSSSLGNNSSNTTEAKAALYGLKWCVQNGINNLILKGYFMLIINMIKGKVLPPWHLKDTIIEAQKLAQKINCQFQYCSREANQVADALAKWSINHLDQNFFTMQNLPQSARGPYIMDQEQMPSLRFKHKKHTFW
ncbi:hypothetical protein RDI58_019876 [Solanum bulbocastanum]|uniref:RNase H type-1 domain-containing protein n=1 Tax=Solanum bulbocastanum TaxID=147425 RepID=A0AAN8Y6Z4_SOLBU